MPLQQFIIVSYDIVSDRRRVKIMKTMEGFGKRVQYSVFECLLKPAQMVEMRRRLKKLVGRDDSIRFYFLGAEDVRRIEVLGSGRVTTDRVFILH